MKSAKCENCGAGVGPGATACAFCGTTFLTAAPGAPSGHPGENPELVRLIRAGQKIEAIKVYRESTRCGLKEAKDAVDALERTLAGRR
ncbi:MAG: ribosomal protein L7/L12 [Deltaproteobacteria bacterium]|nr:ribosomal protein L7/L12 [Myxococcales bacterium]MDP3217370.1 ribosomal protein L7/L12 [Deltaproteobacteria bacterium]